MNIMTTPSSFFTGMIWVAQRKFEPNEGEIEKQSEMGNKLYVYCV